MTSGVSRPRTLIDILGALAGQNDGANVATTISGLGYIGEADEPSASTDTATGLAVVVLTWDQAQWGATTWG